MGAAYLVMRVRHGSAATANRVQNEIRELARCLSAALYFLLLRVRTDPQDAL